MSNTIKVDEELITYLERLSYLTLTDGEKQRLSVDLKEILSGMARLEVLETENVRECSHPFDNSNAFREDDSQASFERNLILKNAPAKEKEMLKVPFGLKKECTK